MKSYWQAFWTLLFPSICLGCQQTLTEGEDLLCTTCRFDLPVPRSWQTGKSIVADKFAGKIPVARAHAYLKFCKGGKVQHLLHQLKYNNEPEVGALLSRLFGVEAAGLGADLLLPVPLHESRQRQRGYNPSDSIAEGLSQVLEIPWSNQLLKKEMASQARKTRWERVQNVAHAFTVTKPECIRNQRIALIDDVVTTGSTLEACAQVLLEKGCREVHIWTLATAL